MTRLAWPAFCLGLLLVLPIWALGRLSPLVDWRILAGIPLALSVFTFFAYRSDKRRAESGLSRIPESTLHLAEFISGWPGAFLAQHALRHKTAKSSFQFVFWAIVLLYQLAALDFLLHGRVTTAALRAIKS